MMGESKKEKRGNEGKKTRKKKLSKESEQKKGSLLFLALPSSSSPPLIVLCYHSVILLLFFLTLSFLSSFRGSGAAGRARARVDDGAAERRAAAARALHQLDEPVDGRDRVRAGGQHAQAHQQVLDVRGARAARLDERARVGAAGVREREAEALDLARQLGAVGGGVGRGLAVLAVEDRLEDGAGPAGEGGDEGAAVDC
jgi:hypothetical protein